MDCPCNETSPNSNEKNSSTITCSYCFKQNHTNCIPLFYINYLPNYTCPSCLINLNDIFLDTIEPIIPSFLYTKTFPLFSKTFTIPYSIYSTYRLKKLFIVIRSLKFCEKKGFDISFPSDVVLKLNNKELISFEKPFQEPIIFTGVHRSKLNKNIYFKPKQILDIEKYFICELNKENKLEIECKKCVKNNKQEIYAIQMDYVRIMRDTEEIINKKVKVFNNLKDIQEYILPSNDENINSSHKLVNEEVNFIDIYSSVDVIKQPSRGWKCKHLSCFDFEKFLEFQRKSHKFICPICSMKVGQIYIDRVLQNIMNTVKHTPILINVEYDYSLVPQKHTTIHNDKPIEITENDNKDQLNFDISIEDINQDMDSSLIKKEVEGENKQSDLSNLSDNFDINDNDYFSETILDMHNVNVEQKINDETPNEEDFVKMKYDQYLLTSVENYKYGKHLLSLFSNTNLEG